MQTAQLTSKGQTTIPASVRLALQVAEGDRLEFVQIAPGRSDFVAATRDVRELKGLFGPAKDSVSVEYMNATIAARGAQAQ